MSKKLTAKEVDKELRKYGCKLMSEYENNSCKIKIQCYCGNIYTTNYATFQQGHSHSCKDCKTFNTFDKLLKKKTMGRIICLEKAIINTKKYKFKCIECGLEFYETKQKMTSNPKCKICRNKKIDYRDELSVKEMLKRELNNEYEFISFQKKHKIKIKHKKCGHIWDVTTTRLISKQTGCPKCNGGIKYSNKEFLNKLNKYVGEEYTPLEEYKSTHKPIKFKHNVCGYEWKVAPSHFFSGVRCPMCKGSNGEKAISSFLTTNNIEYIFQYTVDGFIKNTRLYRFDFAIFKKGKLLALCEFQGQQHYFPVRFNGVSQEIAIQKHKSTINSDKAKIKYCKEHNIELIKIKYDEVSKIPTLLSKFKDMV